MEEQKIVFDAREYLQATTPPVFIAPNGKRYEGRVISYPQWLPYRESLVHFATGVANDDEVEKFGRKFLKKIFPRPWWKIWEKPVWKWIFELPPNQFIKALETFMKSQESYLSGNLPGTDNPDQMNEQ